MLKSTLFTSRFIRHCADFIEHDFRGCPQNRAQVSARRGRHLLRHSRAEGEEEILRSSEGGRGFARYWNAFRTKRSADGRGSRNVLHYRSLSEVRIRAGAIVEGVRGCASRSAEGGVSRAVTEEGAAVSGE